MNSESGEIFFSATTYVVYVETSTARKFEENIAPLKALDVIKNFIRTVSIGKIEVNDEYEGSFQNNVTFDEVNQIVHCDECKHNAVCSKHININRNLTFCSAGER